ncbi:MAG: DUF4118 domain-containing protein [Actinomycetes bacterium]
MTRGVLRIYLGAAPGVGKTFAMLSEGQRRAARGTDVVIGYLADRGRLQIDEVAAGLERIVARHTLSSRDSELDLDALLGRAPQLALIDEFAHVNAAGSRNGRRWEDIEEVLAAGIDVVTTVNVEQLESLSDTIEQITGRRPTETIADSIVRAADQIEIVDMAPEALQRRLAHGNIFRVGELDSDLANYFRLGNLTALRELTLLWLADQVDEGLQEYRHSHGIAETWETRERIVVGLTGGPEGDDLIRRTARIAARSLGGDLMAVHVASSAGLTRGSSDVLARQRRLIETLGGTYHQVVAADVGAALLDFARAENATQLVLGEKPHSPLARLLRPGVGDTIRRRSGDIDVHLVSQLQYTPERILRRRSSIGLQRTAVSLILAVFLPVALTVALTQTRTVINRQSDLLLFLLVIVVTALAGGLWPALLAAAVSFLLVNYWFIVPQYTFRIQDRNSVLAVIVFLLVAVLVSAVVDLASRRTREAAAATAEAETLSTVAGSVLRGDTALDAIFDRFREAFGMTSIALLERAASEGSEGWRSLVSAGDNPPRTPSGSDLEVSVGDRFVLVGTGKPAASHQRRVFVGFASQAAVAIEQQRLATEAAAVVGLEAADRLRTALLAALGHDLRTPLASAKAAVDSLRDTSVVWSDDQRAELLETADSSLDRLARLVDNLLDLSRLQAGVMPVLDEDVDLAEVVGLALAEVNSAIEVDLPPDLAEVRGDAALLERVIANLLANAVRFSKPEQPPWLIAVQRGDVVELQVVDRGPGITAANRDRVFAPFQRLGDTDNTSGVGLGLALSRGLAESMGATISLEDTPGGGLTAVVTMRLADERTIAPPGRRERDISEDST